MARTKQTARRINRATVQRILTENANEQASTPAAAIPNVVNVKKESFTNAIRDALHVALKDVQEKPKVAVGGIIDIPMPLPGLHVSVVGDVPLPLLLDRAQMLHNAGEQAPFGRGSETVVDRNVRNCRQFDAKDVKLSNVWNTAVMRVAHRYLEEMKVAHDVVTAELYKLVLYPPGGFFKPHRDTEKAPGMFASMVIQLPSLFEGGELVVRHQEEDMVFDFSPEGESYFHAAVFYADCEHELRPIKSGYRLCLIYNLVRDDSGPVPRVPSYKSAQNALVRAADNWEQQLQSNDDFQHKFVVPLVHKYTEANLKFRHLKGWDANIASELTETRRFILHLALIEKHDIGEADHYYKGRGTMTDLIDSDVKVLKWVNEDERAVSFEELKVGDNDTVQGTTIFDEDKEPDREEYEGYTGNAGPELQYWYHQAVLVFWPKSIALQMFCRGGVASAIQFATQCANENTENAQYVLTEVIKYAKSRLSNCLSRLIELVDVATTLNDVESTKSVIELMSTTTTDTERYMYYSPHLSDSKLGLCSERHTRVISKAIALFGWSELESVVISAILKTSDKNMGNCAMLALNLQKNSVGENGSNAVAKQVVSRLFETPSVSYTGPHRDWITTESSEHVARMLFSLPSMEDGIQQLIKNAKDLNSVVIAQFVEILDDCGEVAEKEKVYGALVEAFIQKGLMRRPDSTSAPKVWLRLLRARPKYEQLSEIFCDAVINNGDSVLLKALLTERFHAFSENMHVCRIAQARAKQIDYPKPAPSNRQTGAVVYGHPQVEAFLRSDETSMRYSNFNGVRHARNWVSKHFGMRSNNTFCARAIVGGRGGDAYADILKTDGYHKKVLEKYESDRKELAMLCVYLGDIPSLSNMQKDEPVKMEVVKDEPEVIELSD